MLECRDCIFGVGFRVRDDRSYLQAQNGRHKRSSNVVEVGSTRPLRLLATLVLIFRYRRGTFLLRSAGATVPQCPGTSISLRTSRCTSCAQAPVPLRWCQSVVSARYLQWPRVPASPVSGHTGLFLRSRGTWMERAPSRAPRCLDDCAKSCMPFSIALLLERPFIYVGESAGRLLCANMRTSIPNDSRCRTVDSSSPQHIDELPGSSSIC